MKKPLIVIAFVLFFFQALIALEEGLFEFKVQEITMPILTRMVYTWHTDSPVPFEDLRYIILSHYDFDGNVSQGELVAHKSVVDDLEYIFGKLFAVQFPIQSIKLVDDFEGSDLKSMQANNTSAFYARKVARTDRWSNHSFGCAIDINPLINPYSSRRIVCEPEEGAQYLDRMLDLPGMITKDSLIYNVFKERGWGWGGECFVERDGVIDRHHFQKIIEGLNKSTN